MLSLVLILAAAVPTAPPCRAATIRVPLDHPTIYEGLNASVLGDTVLVAPGTYSDYFVQGNSAYVGRPPDGVVLLSEAGPSSTVIDLAPLEGAAIYSLAFGMSFHLSGQTVIDGFHVLGLPPNGEGVGIGNCAHVEVRNCVFESPVPADLGGYRRGIFTRYSDLRVVNCSFIRCAGSSGAGIIHLDAGGPLVVEGSTFVECENQGIRAQAGFGPGPYRAEIRDCVFIRNTSTVGGGSMALQTMHNGVEVIGCVFEESEIVANVGAAFLASGNGLKTVSNNVFRNINLTDGSATLRLVDGTAEV
ncbi:right-handed parallel beta-helix repeat-containing protein, partial [bacterium]|nr:right-handed parallel beta-helix repeat-containing protein [bacterium]